MNGLAAAQYVSYLIVGALYFFYFRRLANVADIRVVGLSLVFVPLVLGGYASALSVMLPRVAASLSFAVTVPFLFLGASGFLPMARVDAALFLISSTAVIAVSMGVWFFNEGSVWQRLTTNVAKIAIAIVAILPAAYATFVLWRFASSLFNGR